MEVVETWYFQIWINFGGMAVLSNLSGRFRQALL